MRISFTPLAIGACGIVAAVVSIIVLWPESSSDQDRSTTPEQTDYFERAADALSVLNRNDAALQYPLYENEVGAHEELVAALAVWESLVPPEDLESQHVAMTYHLRDMVRDYGPNSDWSGGILTFDEPFNRWIEAAESHYRRHLLQQPGGFMEPTYCHDDVLVVPPSDGEFERWQLVILANSSRDYEFGRTIEPREILRVVGLPHETIEVGPSGVVINGQVRADDVWSARESDVTFGPVAIPAETYFLVADRRWKAIDSRNSREIGAPTFFRPHDIIGELSADAKGCEFNSPSE